MTDIICILVNFMHSCVAFYVLFNIFKHVFFAVFLFLAAARTVWAWEKKFISILVLLCWMTEHLQRATAWRREMCSRIDMK